MKKSFLYVFLFFLTSCKNAEVKHTTNSAELNVPTASSQFYKPPINPPDYNTATRIPSSTYSKRMQNVLRCGKIEYSESNYYAKDSNDNVYSLRLDCNKDNKISKLDGNFAINIPESFIDSASKVWLIKWKKQLVRITKVARANPFLCVSVEVSSDPCISHKNVIGFNPQFSLVKK